MTTQILPDQSSTESKSVQVEKMYDSISPKYDLLNRIMSFGTDKGWRKKAVDIIAEPMIINSDKSKSDCHELVLPILH